MNVQELYINMDDSGVLHQNEYCSIYGGLIFFSKQQQDDFGRKYKSILNKIKCCYCKSNKLKCCHICPEIKDTNIHSNHKRWLFNMIQKEICFAVVIHNQKIKKSIMENKNARGRYRDYAQRLLIKRVLEYCIQNQYINPFLPIKLIIRIDQQATSTDTHREFIFDIQKELTQGMTNFEYRMVHKPILYAKLEIDLKYVLSHRHISIQASDLIAGETRHVILSNMDSITMLKKLDYLNIKLFLP